MSYQTTYQSYGGQHVYPFPAGQVSYGGQVPAGQVTYGGQVPAGQVTYGGQYPGQVAYGTRTVYGTQPMGTTTRQVVVNQPQVRTLNSLQVPGNREWSSGMCGCMEDCSSCCCAFWCYPCFMCRLSTQMGENVCGACCCGAGAKWPGLHCPNQPNPFVVAMRTKVRSKYGIEGGICKDTCCVWCCEMCMATQMYREMKHQGAII